MLLPFVPVTATTGTRAASIPRSTSPRTVTPAARRGRVRRVLGPDARARHHEIGTGDESGPVAGRRALDDGRARGLDRGEVLGVAAVAGIVLDDRRVPAGPRDGLDHRDAGRPQPHDDHPAAEHRVTLTR